MKVKFPTDIGPGELKSDNDASLLCYSTSLCLAQTQPRKRKLYGENLSEHAQNTPKIPKAELPQIFMVEDSCGSLEPLNSNTKPCHIPKAIPGEPKEHIDLVEGDSSKTVSIGSGLENSVRQNLINLLRRYPDVFAWQPEDMPGLYEDVAVHNIHIDPKARTIKQKRRNFTPERQQAVDEEISKLMKANFIYEIQFPE